MNKLLALLVLFAAGPAFAAAGSSAGYSGGIAIGTATAGGATAPSYGQLTMGIYQSSPATVTNAYASPILLNSTAAVVTDPQPTAVAAVVSSAAEGSHVLKASAGTFYSAHVTTGASAGYVLLFNATSAPADGAVTPVGCVAVPANQTVALDYGTPLAMSTGITIVFSTTGCFTKTISATAFFSGQVK